MISGVIYNVFFHPLRSFPGPPTHIISRIPYCYNLLKGTLAFDVLRFHEKYGEVVRIAPDELAFCSPSAWKDIMGHKNMAEEFTKQPKFYRPLPELDRENIVNSTSREEHGKLRRTLAHGFSDKAMQAQEPVIRKYVDLLIQRLHENGNKGSTAVDLGLWYNYTTFDVASPSHFPFYFLTQQNR